MLIGQATMAAVDYSGTMYVNTDEGINYIGFVFGYQSNRKFYVVMWRHANMNNPSNMAGIRGIQIKVSVTTDAATANTIIMNILLCTLSQLA